MPIMRLPIALAFLLSLPVSAADWKPADGPLTTPWTAKVRADRPLDEYPRPQMVRSQWTNLNGLWDYAIRPASDETCSQYEGKILAPFPVESALSGVKRPLTPQQRLWYRRTFQTPKLNGGHLLLHFGAVDWRAEVRVNGKVVGRHEGGYDPFTFDITGAVRNAGPNEIAVAVWDPSDSGPQPRGKQVLEPSGIWYTAVSGIWQTVWLEPVAQNYVSSLSMTPDLDARQLRLTVHTPAAGSYNAIARLNGRTVGRLSGKTNEPASLALSELKAWSPDDPVLYDLEVTLTGGDRVSSYFGMRKVEVRADSSGVRRIFLNGHPQFAIGPLDQGWWPDGLYTAPTDEALRFDIETLKRMGFNMLRKHVKVEPARYYYWCDKLGLMVWQDMPSARPPAHAGVKRGGAEDLAFTPEEKTIFNRELDALVENLRNTTSVIAWVPFNEGWGQHDTNEVLQHVKAMDPSRLVDAPSGWEDRGWGDMKDMHQYPGPDMYPASDARASVLGEFGGLGWPVADHLWWDKRNWGYRTFQNREQLTTAYEDLIRKLEPMVKSGLSAAVYTQTTDVEGEVNGLMTYDRKVIKLDPAKLAELHRRLFAAAPGKDGK
jgi:hypothetical protein